MSGTIPYYPPGPSRFALETHLRAHLLALFDTDEAIWNALTEPESEK